ncbi:MAG: hypothetical protein HYR62_05845 [Actinobacteria bacterium]|nr:hypothetical protein [Actinomycetota bacterium]
MTVTPRVQVRGPLRAYPDISVAWDVLASYLGTSFRPELVDCDVCCTFVEAEFARHGPSAFYRLSEAFRVTGCDCV